MDPGSKFPQILTELALQLPVLIAIAGCIALLVARRKRHPAVSALAITGLALMLIHIPVFTTVYAFALDMLPKSPSTADITNLFLILGLIFNLTIVVASTPLLVAIFVKRRR